MTESFAAGDRLRIAYVARWDIAEESGVLKKMAEQLRCWIASGCDATLFVHAPRTGVWPGLESVPLVSQISRSPLDRERSMRRLLTRALEWAPDLAYLRFGHHYWAIESFMANVPTVIELNTNDLAELKVALPGYKYWYHRVTRRRLLDRAAALVGVSREVVNANASFGKRSAVIANGIDLSAYAPLPPARKPRLHAVFMAAFEADWHGLDKIILLAQRLPLWDFSLLGPLPSTRELPANVRAHGPLARREYQRVLATADVGIGTLALHRKQMQEASPLKVREYLAFGLPCIIAYEDTDFPKPEPFILRLPNREDNVAGSIEQIRSFGERWRGRRVERDAIEHLDAARKERERIRFFREVLHRGSPSAVPCGVATALAPKGS